MRTTRKPMVIGIAAAGLLAAAFPLQAVEEPLTGTIIGNLPGKELVFDGNTTNYPDTGVNNSWAGRDLGAGAFKQVTKIRYVPRDNIRSRMIGSKFQGSHTADFSSGVVTLHQVTAEPPSGWTEVTISNTMGFRYLRILVSDTSFGNVSEVEFLGDVATQALAAPAAPTVLAATVVTDTQIDLSWTDNSNNEDLFLIERKKGVDGSWAEIAVVAADVASYSNTGLDPGTLYSYSVRAFNSFEGAANSADSNEASATTTGVAPSPKLIGVGSVIGNLNSKERIFDGNVGTFPDTGVDNSWAGLDFGEGAFKQVTKLRYFPRGGELGRTVGSKFQGSHTPDFSSGVITLHEVTAVPPGGWTDVAISNPNGFRYLRILVSNSSYGNVCEVEFYGFDATQTLAAPAAPTALTATVVTDNQIDLSWTDHSTNEAYFLIERIKDETGSWTEIAVVAADVTNYSNIGLDPGTRYDYRVSAFNSFAGGTTSDFTNEASATTTGTAPPAKLIGSIIGDINNRQVLFDGNTGSYTEDADHYIAGLNLDGEVKKVTSLRFAPRSGQSGRMIGGKFQGSTTADFSSGVVTLYTVPNSPPSGFNTIPTGSLLFTNIGFKAVRYVAPPGSYSNVAELEFYGVDYGTPIHADPPLAPAAVMATVVSDFQINLSWTDNSDNEDFFSIERQSAPAGPWVEIATVAPGITSYTGTATLEVGTEYAFRVRAHNDAITNDGFSDYSAPVSGKTTGTPKFIGTPIGTPEGNPNIDVSKAFDGNTSTFFESGASGAWVGLDFGPTVVKQITKIRFFPRAGWNGRMNNGVFEGSNTPDFSSGVVTLYTVAGTPPAGWSQITAIASTASFRYVRFLAANGQAGGNPAEIQFFGTPNETVPFTIPGGALVVSGTSATMTIPASAAGTSYSLFYSDTMEAGSWLPVTGNPQAGGGVLTWTDDITTAPQRFYRMTAQ